MIDLAAEVRAALASRDVAGALAEVLRPIIAAEVRGALAERDADTLLDMRALAALLGISPAALRQRLRRGSPLAALAVDLDGRRCWRRSEVLAAIRRPEPGARSKLHAIDGGRS